MTCHRQFLKMWPKTMHVKYSVESSAGLGESENWYYHCRCDMQIICKIREQNTCDS